MIRSPTLILLLCATTAVAQEDVGARPGGSARGPVRHCDLLVDRIEAGTMASGAFEFSVRVSGQERSRGFLSVSPAKTRTSALDPPKG